MLGGRSAITSNVCCWNTRESTGESATQVFTPENWVWTSRYLELASNQLTAEMTASFFPPGIRVVDIGCGGGADATSLVKQREVLAIDRNPLAIQLTQANWQLQSSDRGVLNAKSPTQRMLKSIQKISSTWIQIADRRTAAASA